MTYNEAIVVAREKATETLKSWYIFFDGQDDYLVRAEPRRIHPANQRVEKIFRLTAIINPVWAE